jgi:hypothetical protein
MPEIQKYNLKEKLLEADERYRGDPAVAGMSSMTHFRYNNSTRTQMFTSHLNQVVNSVSPEVPFVMSGAENVVGRNSSGYKKVHDMKVYRKVVKFEDILEHPFVYVLFFWDKKKKRYDMVKRKPTEELGQNYGYMYNNDFIDSLEEGDEVKDGTVLYRSTSYDPYMNYRFGVNLNTMYTFDPFTAEDAAEISEYASVALSTVHPQKIAWGWNNNDIPLNLFGDDDHYQPLPNIGQTVEGYLASSRPLINEQVLYDFTHRNLRMIRDGDCTILYNGTAMVVDYDIFCNDPDIPDNSFNHQIIDLLHEQDKYWKKIYQTCKEIMDSGKPYTRKIDSLFKRARDFIDRNPNLKWNDGNSVFGNLKIHAHIMEISPLSEGGKFTARYGNKSVVSRVLKNEDMPFSSDGKRVDVLLHLPSITNRTTAFVPHEMEINWITECAVGELAKMKTLREQEKFYFEILGAFNEKQAAKFHSIYKRLTTKEKKEFMKSVIDTGGINVHQDSINEDRSIFYKLLDIAQKYDFAKSVTLYIRKWGHLYRICQSYRPGKMYFMPLKQTDSRGFSARNTGAINMKGLPERSYKNKRNEAPFSDTAIRFGEYESLNFLIGLEPDELAVLHGCYRSSPEATSDLTKSQFMEHGLKNMKRFYKSRSAEIFSVFYKHLGLELQFNDKNKQITGMDNEAIRMHTYNGKSYMMTDYEFYQMKLKDEIRTEILNQNVVMQGNNLERQVEEEMKHGKSFIMGPRTELNAYGKMELPEEVDTGYISLKKREQMKREEEAERQRILEEEQAEKEAELLEESDETSPDSEEIVTNS